MKNARRIDARVNSCVAKGNRTQRPDALAWQTFFLSPAA